MTIEIRVREIKRYQVTRYSDAPGVGQIETMAENLTATQADNIAMAVAARDHASGKSVIVQQHGEPEGSDYSSLL